MDPDRCQKHQSCFRGGQASGPGGLHVHVRDQIVFTERNKVAELEADYQRIMHLSLEMREKLNKQLSTTVDEYEIEEENEIETTAEGPVPLVPAQLEMHQDQ